MKDAIWIAQKLGLPSANKLLEHSAKLEPLTMVQKEETIDFDGVSNLTDVQKNKSIGSNRNLVDFGEIQLSELVGSPSCLVPMEKETKMLEMREEEVVRKKEEDGVFSDPNWINNPIIHFQTNSIL